MHKVNLNFIFRVNKDISQINTEIGDVRAATDEVARSKVNTLEFNVNNTLMKIHTPGFC